MYDYMQPNVVYNYKWLPTQLLVPTYKPKPHGT
jgi:hypothetical protein